MDTALTTAARAVLFAHWRLPPAELRPHVPEPLELDIYDGAAWLGALAFEVTEARPRALPPGLAPTGSFGQTNLRTYVRYDGDPGVHFLSLDAGSRVGAAGLANAMGLPCYGAETEVDVTEECDEVRSVSYRSRRSHPGQPPATFAADYAPAGEASPVDPGSLAEFCIERKRWFTVDGRPSPYLSAVGNGVRVGEIRRDPRPVAPATATVTENSLARAVGIEVDGEPRVRYSPGFRSTIAARR
jgi:uncharacterized protein YqjF (DUF2071 family)